MNSLLRLSRFIPALLIGLLACTKPSPEIEPGAPVDPNDPSNSGAPTEVGTPIGSPVLQSIGPAGGTINSVDGRVSVRFPAGALDAPTNIQLQLVTQTAPVETESPSIAILPANLITKKPVEISYLKNRKGGRKTGDAAEETGGWIAQQRSDNSWEVQPSSITETSSEVVVKVVRMGYFTHFYPYVIEPKNLSGRGVLAPNEPIQLLVRRNFVSSAGASGAVILKPLSQTKPEELLISSDAIDSVTVNGLNSGSGSEGLAGINFNHALGYSIQYTAPQRQPKQSPVRISAYFMTPHSGYRMATTTVSVENDCRFRFRTSDAVDAAAMGSVINGGLMVSIQDSEGGYNMGFQISGTKPGTYPFKNLLNMVNAGSMSMFGEIYHQSYGTGGGGLIDNSGSVQILEFAPVKGFPNRTYVRGKVSGRLSKPYDCGDKTCWEHAPVEASFAFVF